MTEETPKTEIAPINKTQVALADRRGFQVNTLEEAWRLATAYSRTKLVPETFQGKPDDCLIAIELAQRHGTSALAVMQSTYMVKGRPGMLATYTTGLVNGSGVFNDPLDYEVDGTDPFNDKYRVRAFATRSKTGKTLYGPWIDWKLVRGEGWDKKEGSKWKTMPGQMFIYRAATFFVRAYCPEILMGIRTTDELEDTEDRKTVESHEVRGVQGLVSKLQDKIGNREPQQSQPEGVDEETGEVTIPSAGPAPVQDEQPPVSPEATTEAEPPEQTFYCLQCKSKGRSYIWKKSELRPNQVCPTCFSRKDIVDANDIK